MSAFHVLLKFHHISWCNNGQGTGPVKTGASGTRDPRNIGASIEPIAWLIGHIKCRILGEGEIARAKQQSNNMSTT